MHRGRLALVMMVIAAACDQPIQVTATPLDGEVSPRSGACRSAQDVDLYLSQPPPRPYEEIALVRVLGNMDSGDAQQLASLRARTAALCADAVVQVTHGTQARDILLCDDCQYDATVSRGVAVRYLREGGEPHPEDRRRADTLVAQARDADAAGQGWVADELLRRAVGLDPSQHGVAAGLARRRFDAGDAGHAIALFRLAVGAAPDQAAYRRGLADALLDQGQRHEARMQYRRAARLGDRGAAEALAQLDGTRG